MQLVPHIHTFINETICDPVFSLFLSKLMCACGLSHLRNLIYSVMSLGYCLVALLMSRNAKQALPNQGNMVFESRCELCVHAITQKKISLIFSYHILFACSCRPAYLQLRCENHTAAWTVFTLLRSTQFARRNFRVTWIKPTQYRVLGVRMKDVKYAHLARSIRSAIRKSQAGASSAHGLAHQVANTPANGGECEDQL